MIESCEENEFVIVNIKFKQPKRRLYTWTSPNERHHNQIDYVTVKKRWCSSAISVKTRSGADCGTDHELLVAKVKIKLCKVKCSHVSKRYDLTDSPQQFAIVVKNKFQNLHLEEKDPEEIWEAIKTSAESGKRARTESTQ